MDSITEVLAMDREKLNGLAGKVETLRLSLGQAGERLAKAQSEIQEASMAHAAAADGLKAAQDALTYFVGSELANEAGLMSKSEALAREDQSTTEITEAAAPTTDKPEATAPSTSSASVSAVVNQPGRRRR
jgi:hypothetical protein